MPAPSAGVHSARHDTGFTAAVNELCAGSHPDRLAVFFRLLPTAACFQRRTVAKCAGPRVRGGLCSRPAMTGVKMAEKTALELEVAQLIVEALNLEDVKPESIDPEAALFREGLGLDSIDALELALAISKKYGFKLQSDDKQNSEIFSSLRALTRHVEQNRAS